jgi:2-polyprenyl-3-methyl-5-hydroxy-6-metoxy-1,4-benzoquinol methylase
MHKAIDYAGETNVGAVPMKTLTMFSELDEALLEAHRLAEISHDALIRHLSGFRMKLSLDHVGHPHSAEYRQAQLELYSRLTGRKYSTAHEAHPFDLARLVDRPYPYDTGSAETVGAQLIAIGYLIRAMGLPPGAEILEMGPGWGNTSLAFAQMGYKVTAIDIEARYLELVRERARRLNVSVEMILGDFFAVETMNRRFDAILFFESFHHCDDHLRLLDAIPDRLKSGGKLVLAGEPVEADLPYPWGINLGGEALYSITRYGWLELAFREDYLLDTLRQKGWDVVKHPCPLTAAGVTFVATRSDEAHLLAQQAPPVEFVWAEQYQLETGHYRAIVAQHAVEICAVKAEKEAIKAERDTVKAEIGAVKAEMDAIKTSTSWRITTPLRAIGNFLKRYALRAK